MSSRQLEKEQEERIRDGLKQLKPTKRYRYKLIFAFFC